MKKKRKNLLKMSWCRVGETGEDARDRARGRQAIGCGKQPKIKESSCTEKVIVFVFHARCYHQVDVVKSVFVRVAFSRSTVLRLHMASCT